MIGRNVLEEDILLKQYAHASDKDKPRFNWSDFAQEEAPELPGKLQIKIEIGGQVRDYNIADVADTVGGALTDLLLSRKEENIFESIRKLDLQATLNLISGIHSEAALHLQLKPERESSSRIPKCFLVAVSKKQENINIFCPQQQPRRTS